MNINALTGVFCFDSWVREVRKLGYRICGQFHDEIIIPFKKGQESQIASDLTKAIENVNEKLKEADKASSVTPLEKKLEKFTTEKEVVAYCKKHYPDWEVFSDGTSSQQNTPKVHRVVLVRFEDSPKSNPEFDDDIPF